MMNEKQIKDRIYELEQELAVYKKILETPEVDKTNLKLTPITIKIGRPLGKTKYTEEQITDLKNWMTAGYSYEKVNEEWNKKYKEQAKATSRRLYNIAARMGIYTPTPRTKIDIKCPECQGLVIKKGTHWSAKYKKMVQTYGCKNCNRRFENENITENDKEKTTV